MKKMVGGGKVLFLVPVLVLGSTSVLIRDAKAKQAYAS